MPQVVVVDDRCKCFVLVPESHGRGGGLLVHRIEGEFDCAALDGPVGEAGDLVDGVR